MRRVLLLLALVLGGCDAGPPADDGIDRIDRSAQTWVWTGAPADWIPHVQNAVQWWADRGYVTGGEWQPGQPDAPIRIRYVFGDARAPEVSSTWDAASARIDVTYKALRNSDGGAYFTEVVRRELGKIFTPVPPVNPGAL